jgi:hypothetical protein
VFVDSGVHQNNQNATRYSINGNINPMPVGLLKSGHAPVDYSSLSVPGSGDPSGTGEGAFKATQDGTLQIDTKVYVAAGEFLKPGQSGDVIFTWLNKRSGSSTDHHVTVDSLKQGEKLRSFVTTFDVLDGDILTMTAVGSVIGSGAPIGGSVAYIQNPIGHYLLENIITHYSNGPIIPTL